MKNMKPILLYKGVDICYNILNVFAEQFGEALKKQGCEVLYYDVEKEGLSGLAQYAGQEFTAIVGFQTYAFDPYLESRKCFLHDLFGGLKFNFQLDHPIWMRAHYEKGPRDYYVLTHDRHYQAFIKKYYRGVKDALLLPPGGVKPEAAVSGAMKTKDLIFLGTYNDYRELLGLIRKSDRNTRFLAGAFLLEMTKYPNQTAEDALRKVLFQRHHPVAEKDFLNVMDSLKPMINCVMIYYREKVVRTLLDAGISLIVFGESWKKAPFADHPLLSVVPSVSPEESLKELACAKLSLNVMAWHKDGFTERIANSMLYRSIVVSDRSTCLEEQYKDGEELILFDLMDLSRLPDQIRTLLQDDKRREEIAERAYQRAIAEDTWDQRAALFLMYCEELRIK